MPQHAGRGGQETIPQTPLRHCEKCGNRIYQSSRVPWCQNCMESEEEVKFCYLCSTRHRADEFCPCIYCGSKQHTSSECTSCSANVNKYLGETVPNVQEMRGYPCVYCKVAQPPHRGDCPKIQPKRLPKPRIISPGQEGVNQKKEEEICKVCRRMHETKRCEIRRDVLRAGYCKWCGANYGEHNPGCVVIQKFNNVGICFYCGQESHWYEECPYKINNTEYEKEMRYCEQIHQE